MHESKGKQVIHAKSYTSIYDIFGHHPFNNILYNNPNKTNQKNMDISIFQAFCGDTDIQKSVNLNEAPYVTSERYYLLNKDASHGSVVRSTSTIFYDLDEVARRQSFHCLVESTKLNSRDQSKPKGVNGFRGKTTAIVQECATQMHPKLLTRDSMEINSKKVKKKFPNDLILSSEIFLRDNDYEEYYKEKDRYYDKEITDRHQKFWSYAKYRTEYTRPIPEEKKSSKKKDRGKRTEDPCPCQLFSYACPCTDKQKSLTELAKNSKSLTVAEAVRSTLKINQDNKIDLKCKSKKLKQGLVKECKLTNTSFEKNNRLSEQPGEQVLRGLDKNDVPRLVDPNEKASVKSKSKSIKRSRQIICPNCKEKVEIQSSTEEDENSKLNSMTYRSQEIASTAAYTCRASSNVNSPKRKTLDEIELCNHQPPCELIPICQILPESLSPKMVKKIPLRQTPRVIRITKACRHHPPCTVVPSCQRANVLNNNCEFIPPCLHRPRCVNLPLCVPLSKTVNIDDFTHNQAETVENVNCPHAPKCNYVPEYQQESLDNSVTPPFIMSPQIQNACEFINKYQYAFNPKVSTTFSPIVRNFSPLSVPSPTACGCSKSTKSCQYDCADCKCNATKEVSSDPVIFIRDVGCQFRDKTYTPKDSLVRSKTSSASFDYVDVKMGTYYTGVHTLRYEDKFTNPITKDFYISSDTISSPSEIDSQCPSHGHRAKQTGFIPKNTSQYVARALTTYANSKACHLKSNLKKADESLEKSPTYHTHPVNSKKSFLKGKCKRMFGVRRRRKSKVSNHILNDYSKQIYCYPNTDTL